MMAPDFNNEVPLDGFDVHGASNYIIQSTLSTAPNQALQLVSQGSHSSGSANVDGINSVGILSGSDSRAGRTSSSNLKSSKKKKCYYHRRSGEKKERLIWTPELHQSFLEYYNRSPNEKRVPKKILEEMRKTFPYITRENVASHLQKHRLYLKNSKNIKEMGNSAKSSSKSVPRKVTREESNFHQFYNNSTVSTAQFPHQSHSSISTSPNSSQLPLQSHTLVHDQTLLNQVLSQFDETHLSDENMVHSLDIDWNNIPIHGGANIYSNMMNNVLESQRNPFGVIGQSSNAANNSDFPVRVNHLFPPPIIPTNNHDQLISNIDGNGNGFQDPIMGNSFGVLTGNDYSLAALPNFLYYNMNLNLDHLQVDGMNNMYSLGSYSDSLQFDYPLNLNVANELQPQDFEQALRSILYQPGNHLVDDASTWPQIFRKSMGRRL